MPTLLPCFPDVLLCEILSFGRCVVFCLRQPHRCPNLVLRPPLEDGGRLLTRQHPLSWREDVFPNSDHRLPVLALHAKVMQANSRVLLGSMEKDWHCFFVFSIVPRPVQD